MPNSIKRVDEVTADSPYLFSSVKCSTPGRDAYKVLKCMQYSKACAKRFSSQSKAFFNITFGLFSKVNHIYME